MDKIGQPTLTDRPGPAQKRPFFLERFIDPATSLAEILFGLIMTLTFTLGAGIIIEEEGREGARQLLIAVLGCNVAWGIIDAALYLVGELFSRGRVRTLGRVIRRAPDRATAVALVADELEPLTKGVLNEADRRDLYARIVTNVSETTPKAVKLTKADWLGAFTSFWLVVFSSLPAALPFLLMDDAHLALRTSNAVLLALLFLTGYWWGRYVLSRAFLVGTAFLACGLGLVVAAIALGG